MDRPNHQKVEEKSATSKATSIAIVIAIHIAGIAGLVAALAQGALMKQLQEIKASVDTQKTPPKAPPPPPPDLVKPPPPVAIVPDFQVATAAAPKADGRDQQRSAAPDPAHPHLAALSTDLGASGRAGHHPDRSQYRHRRQRHRMLCREGQRFGPPRHRGLRLGQGPLALAAADAERRPHRGQDPDPVHLESERRQVSSPLSSFFLFRITHGVKK